MTQYKVPIVVNGGLFASQFVMTDSLKNLVSVDYDPTQLAIDSSGLYILESGLDHDALTNFAANEHIDHSAVSVLAGTGMSGGGLISGNVTLNCSITQYTDELAQDAVGGMLLDTNSIDLTYVDGTPSLSADLRYQNTASIDLAVNAYGLKADLNSTLKSNYDAAYTHSQIAGGNSVHVSTAENTAWDTAYTHSGLTTGNPHSVTKSDVSLGSVENTALSTWAGTTNLTTLGTIATGVWNGTDIAIADGGTGQGTAQLAINALSAVGAATNEHVLTKDTVTGNALWKAATGGADAFTVKVDAAAAADYIGAGADGVLRAGTGLTKTDGGNFVTLAVDADYTDISANDAATDVTGAELETLTNGSETTLHSHVGGGGDLSHVSVFLNANQTIGSGSWITIQFANETYDTLGDFNTGTYKFTAPVTGYYHVSYIVNTSTALAAGKIQYTRLLRNAAGQDGFTATRGVIGGGSYTYAHTLYLTAADTLVVQLYQDTGGNVVVEGHATAGSSIFTIDRLMPAGTTDGKVKVDAGATAGYLGAANGDVLRTSTGITKTDGGDFITLTTNDSQIAHDSLSGYSANKHIDHSAVSVLAGTGMSGGGLISGNVTLNCSITQYTDELAQDAVGGMLLDTNSIDLTYVDGTPSLSADLRYQNSATIDLSVNVYGLKADLNSTLKSNYDAAYTHSQVAGGNSVHVSTAENTAWDTAYSHSQLTSGNPHSVTPTELNLVIGTNVQAYDAGLSSLAGLTFASASFLKCTAENTYALRTISETKSDLSLNLVENTALSTWVGTTNLTTLGTIATGVWNGTDIAIADGGTGQSTAQLAINALSAVGAATNEHILTKDTATGNAIFKAAPSGDAFTVKVDAAATAGYLGAANADVLRTSTGITKTDGGDFITLTTNDSQIAHDSLSGYSANKHIDHTAVSISPGTGMSGGGDISANRTLTNLGLLGDGTAGRVLRVAQLRIVNGTNANTVKCTLSSIWNGDVIAVTDNIAKNATTGNFWMGPGGTEIRILSSGIAGDPIAVFPSIAYNDTTVNIFITAKIESEPSLEITSRLATTGASQDWTVVVDTGVGTVLVNILYLTTA